MRRLLLLPLMLLTACNVAASAEPRPTILTLTTPTAIPANTATPELPYPEPVIPTPDPFEGAVPTSVIPFPVAAYPAPLQANATITVAWLSVGRIHVIWNGSPQMCLFKKSGLGVFALSCTPGLLVLPPPAPYDQVYAPRQGDVYFVSDSLLDAPDAQAILGEAPKSVFFRFLPFMAK